ncbi:MAG: choice-of-anchor J domain-containing protein, partial [Bacteroidales bacterium]|nr:choice-of-anchor J domain-containing protein [Bacteroidales bacterium]
KDQSVANGSDCGWIDYVIFPPVAPMAAMAVPYFTDFDLCGSLPGGWYNAMSDDFDWTANSGGTPSSNTGPSGDHTTGSGYYVYTESSNPNYPNKHAYLISPLFDFTNIMDAQLNFWYNMNGAAMGDLHLDVYMNGNWANDVMPVISGNQGSQWQQRIVDLTAYAGQEVKLRFRGITGSSYTSDIAIDDVEITGTIGNFIQMDLKAFLEGPFSGSEMSQFLNNYGYLPLSQPYNIEPFFYTGTEAVTSIPNNDIVDWVLVELRETTGNALTATPSTMIDRKAGFILKDGMITGIDGISLLEFDLTINDNLFVVIYHRNHLGIMSNNPLPVNGIVYNYDYTTGPDQVCGGIIAHKEVGAGIWGMISGDGNCDGQVSTGDKLDVWNQQTGSSGYKQGDFNLNSNVDNNDKIDFWAPNAGMGAQVPK